MTLFGKITTAVMFLAATLASCAPSLFKKPSGEMIDAGRVIERLRDLASEIKTNQRFFKLRVYDDGNTYQGEALYLYQYPDDYRLNILTPFGTTFVEIIERNGVFKAKPEDRFQKVFGDLGMNGKFLEWFTGFYTINDIIDSSSVVQASRDGSDVLLSIFNGATVHQLTMDSNLTKVLRYISETHGKADREITFHDFSDIEGISRPKKVVYLDFRKNREVTSIVTSEKINQALDEQSFEFSLE